MDILRCQVRVVGGDEYGPCGAEAKAFETVVLETPALTVAFLVCDQHASAAAEDIGFKNNDELREHVRFFGAEPAF